MNANPLALNPLKTRHDAAEAVKNLFNPLLPYFSEGGGRVRLGGGSAIFDRTAADLEGFARPLWGLVPLAAGGGQFDHWDLYRRGLESGTNPASPDYWGPVRDYDQRLVELAAIGFGLAMIPHILWEPLSEIGKRNLARYLLDARQRHYVDSNWKFFRVLVDLGLRRVGIDHDRSLTEAYLDDLDGFYIGDGWYRDGNVRRLDHYIPFAMHFYGLIYAVLADDDAERAQRYRDRAQRFAADFRHWFDADGAVLPFGRSLTYRFAMGSLWGGLAFAGIDALPWGEMKALWLNHLRWWSKRDIADRDGVLSIGYAYPNLLMSEEYNSPGSPYWALKAFLPLALGEDHPFWQAEETPPPETPAPVVMKHPGLIVSQAGGHATALSSGQENRFMRCGAEKYTKFAYSSHYGFSVESNQRRFELGAFDSALALSDDGEHYRVRESNLKAELQGERLYALWQPFDDVSLETWLMFDGPWQVRVHRIATPRPLESAEGGFAVNRADYEPETVFESADAAAVRAPDFTGIVDLGSECKRHGLAQRPLPNTSVMFSRSWVPQLRGYIPAGETVLLTGVLASPDAAFAEAAWSQRPQASIPSALSGAVGTAISAMAMPR